MTKLVKDLMHAGLITCKPDATIGQVAVLLNQHHIHALSVTDRDGRVIGIISDFDLLAGEWLSSDSESLNTKYQDDQSVFVDLPVCVSPYAWEQDKDHTNNDVHKIWTDLFHGDLRLNWSRILSV